MTKDKNQNEIIKVVIMGMENAGKSTIVDVLIQKIENTPLTPPDMSPTKSVERSPLIENISVVWDFGGQELYRNEYLADPESYLRFISYTYYVVDVQDYYRFYAAVMYFMAVFPTIITNSPNTEIFFLFHKMDPNFDPNFKNLKKKFLQNVEPYLKTHKIPFVIYNTSIFDLNSIKTAFGHVL